MNVRSACPKHLHFSSAKTTENNNIINWISFHKACQSHNSCSHGIVTVKNCFVYFWCWWEVLSSCTAKVTTVMYNKMWNVFRMLLFSTLRNPPKSMDWGKKADRHCTVLHPVYISFLFQADQTRDLTMTQNSVTPPSPSPPLLFRYYSSHPTPFQTLFPPLLFRYYSSYPTPFQTLLHFTRDY